MIEIKLYDKKLSPYFDAIIGVLVLMFVAVLFVPQSLWSEEDKLRDECRVRMENLYELEIEFYRLVNRFPESPEEAMKIVNMALDSVRADTSFYGAETLRVDTLIYAIDTQGDLLARVDTLMNLPINDNLFSCPFVHERYVIDIENNRRIYIACPIRKELDPFKITLVESDDSLRSLFAEIIDEDKYEVRSFTSIHDVLPLQKEWNPELIVIDDRTINDETTGIVDELFENDEDVLVILMMQMEQAKPTTTVDTTDSVGMDENADMAMDSSGIEDSVVMAMDSSGMADSSDEREKEMVTQEVVRRLPTVSGTVPYSFTLGDLKDKIEESVLLSPRHWLREDYYKRRYLVFTMVDSIHGYIDDGDRSWVSSNR